MNNPSWDVFRSRDNQELVFEKDVARRLFCHEARVDPSSLTCPPQYPGIENVPVQNVDGDWVAFQAKHSRNGTQNGDAFRKLRKVIKPVQDGDYQLNKIYCFSSGVAPDTTTALTAGQQRVVAELEAEGISVDWYYEDRILTILEDATTPNLMRASQAFFEIHPQPYLDPQDSTPSPEGFRQLRFNERRSEFGGRDEELAELRDFTQSGDPFSWWHVTGPGFSGKSRLVLEHCLSLDEWHWGWLESDLHTFPFSEWLPDRDTFIVIDYALGREPEIQRLFQGIVAAIQSDRFVFKVRLILIEREYSGWLSAIEHAPNIGNWVADRKFCEDGLALERLPIALAAIDNFPAGEFTLAVRELLHRERHRRWQNLSPEAHDALVLATATGGFSLENLPDQLRPETRAYLEQLNCSADVARMIGAEHHPHSYASLQPDVFGELYVLDTIQNTPPITRPVIFQRAFELNASGFTNFMYRCGQSFPDHPGLINSFRDWSYDGPSRLVYLATFANSLDVIPFTQPQRVETYKNIMSELAAPSGDLTFIERAIFGKILALFPNNRLEIIPSEIQLRPPVNIEPLSPNPDALENLLPEDYCNGVLEAWRLLEEGDQIALLGPHLVEVFQHQLIRPLSDRQSDIESQKNLFAELTRALTQAAEEKYASTIYAFQSLCVNLVAALIQFNHNSETAMDWADEIRGLANSLSTLERDGQSLFLYSSKLDRIELGLSVLAAHSRKRDWQYKFERTEAIRVRGTGMDSLKMLIYSQAAVQITSGFSGEDQARRVREVLEFVREYSSQTDKPQIAEALVMMLGNLTGYAENYDLGQSPEQFFAEAVELACRFPEPQHRLIQTTLHRLSAAFQNQLNSGEIDAARLSLSSARRMIEAANEYPHEDNARLHAGAFIGTPILRYVQGLPSLYDEARDLAMFMSNSQAVNWGQMMSNIGAFSQYFGEAQRAINDGDQAKAERALEALEFFEALDQSTDYSQAIGIIRGRIDP